MKNLIHFRRSHPRLQAFTLVEVLVVLAIISIIMFFAVPDMGAIIKGSKLTQAGDELKFILGEAQQTAVKENLTVEVRFFQYKLPEVPPEMVANMYTAYQIFRLLPDSEKAQDPTAKRILAPINEVKKLPSGVVIPYSDTWSSLLVDPTITGGTQEIPGLVPTEKLTSASFRSFQINPDGTTNLDTSGKTAWYISLVNYTDLEKAGGSVESIAPDNYICLQVDPFSGGTRWYQPN